MGELTFSPVPEFPLTREFGHDLLPTTLGQTLSAITTDPLISPIRGVGTAMEIQRARGLLPGSEEDVGLIGPGGVGLGEDVGGMMRPESELSPYQSPEELNQRYGQLGLHFDRPERSEVAAILARQKRADLIRGDVMARGPRGVFARLAQFGMMLTVGAVDPFNVAAAFVPVMREARYAALVARAGRIGARATRGVVEGAVGNVLIEPLVFGMARSQQLDYEMTDALLNVMIGGAIGGVAHVAFGRLGDALVARPVAETDAAHRAAVAQFVTDRRIDVEPVFRERPMVQGIDPLDPRVALAEPQLPPGVRDFELGRLRDLGAGPQYSRYTVLKPADRLHLQAVVDELESTGPGHRVFLEAEGQGSTPEVIGVKGDTPQWFQLANTEIRAEQRALAKARRTATDAERAALPVTPEILTRKRVKSVADKLLAGKPLGPAEGRIAEEIVAAARARRTENVAQMTEFRRGRDRVRSRERDAEIDAIARREADPANDTLADLEQSARATEEVEADPGPTPESLEEEIAFQRETVDEMRTAGLLTKEDEGLLAALEEQQAHAEAYGKGARAAAACLGRTS